MVWLCHDFAQAATYLDSTLFGLRSLYPFKYGLAPRSGHPQLSRDMSHHEIDFGEFSTLHSTAVFFGVSGMLHRKFIITPDYVSPTTHPLTIPSQLQATGPQCTLLSESQEP